MSLYECRFCKSPLTNSFVNLGVSPLSNAYLKEKDIHRMEPFYPLHAYVCGKCLLVQLPAYETPENIFSDYAYFTSYSDTALKHANDYVVKMVERFGLDSNTQVVEIASNDGYLLKNFKEKGIPVLGIEPAANVAESAVAAGIPSIVKFFGVKTAEEVVAEHKQADLLVGNNVLAHVPDLNDFVKGLKVLLKPDGVITMEFAHVMRMMNERQFDQIYHEHFCYFSFATIKKVFAKSGMFLFDVEELSTHGGSLRIYACHDDDSSKTIEPSVNKMLSKEEDAGLTQLECYSSFAEKVNEIKRKLWSFIIKAKSEGKSLVGYGAPAKANTLLVYCGIGSDFIDYTVDLNTYKQGRFLPGTHIPVYHPDKIKETKPDFLLIMPWNIKDEIMEQTSYIREWGGKFVILIPEVRVYS